jgi:hypothetical protein
MTWYYQNKIFEPSEELLSEYIGFVYIITEKETDMKYVGKKLFHRTKTLPANKTRKRKKKTLVESDWQTYYGSSTQVKENLKMKGPESYHREILRLCKSKGECSYYEAKEQFDREVLLRDDYYNGIINCRINATHLKK